ncbi:DUF1343 domain-containing protein [Myxococcota bacterium]|nr:DUF1343 domain-containing protein [Myxococcota bacterium]
MVIRVRTGLDVLVAEGFRRLRGQRVGLLAHPASIDASIRHVVPLMHAAGLELRVLLGPEHGINGEAQDMETVEGDDAERDPVTGARIYSLYGASIESLHPTPEMVRDLDVLVIDLQDVGARYYTFAATMIYAMKVAGAAGVRVMVLDRPNPLGGRDEDLEGPALEADHHSFVGDFEMPIRHGLTIGEYAKFVHGTQNIRADLEVVAMEGWRRDMDFEATGLPWVLPSPNMPTVDTAWIYPGQCLLEGTNLSEGRGTTRPFELSGAPYLDGHAWAKAAAPHVGPGFVLRPTVIRPTFQKHAKQRCGALQVHVTDRWAARSLRLSIALIEAARRLAPGAFDWRRERYEFVSDRLAIDLLFGSDAPRKMLEAGATTDDVVATFAEYERAFAEIRRPYLLYPR